MSDEVVRKLLRELQRRDQVEDLLRELCKEVYVVTQGSYSDYRICGVFLSRSDAEAWVAKDLESREAEGRYVEPSEVEVWRTQGSQGEQRGCWEVILAPNGNVRHGGWCSERFASDLPTSAASREGRLFYVAGYGDSEEHARRSAEQLRREILAGHREAGSPARHQEGGPK